MKHTELEDGKELVTRLDLRETLLSVHEDMLAIKKEILALRNDFALLRNSMRWQIIVPSLTLVVSLIIHYILK